MKLLLLTFAILVIKVFADDCGGEKYKKINGTGIVMECRKGVWKVSKRLSKPKGPPCMDDASLSASGTCSADRGHCQQYTDAGVNMDRDCPETCESCDACRCQDASQWHSYCPVWAQYCSSSGVLGNWMTSNCRKTCGKCKCKCCSYGGKQHQLGARIRLPEKCGELICEEGLVADYSPLLKGAVGHKVSHPEELTLNFWSVHDGADCCILPGSARSADGSSFPNGTMVPEGWSGNLMTRRGSVSTICCHGVLSVPLEEAIITSVPTTSPEVVTVPINATLPQCKIESLSFALDISGSMGGASEAVWKPVAVGLVDEMARRQVSIDRHYLFTYVDTIQGSLTTQKSKEFRDKIDNWSSYTGSRELTFAALKHAMEQVNSNAFVCVWTDEIGDDTNDATLKSQILTLKATTNSEIFFMVLTPNINGRKVRQETEETQVTESDDDNSKKRASVTLAAFEQKFKDIGHVMDITNDPNVITKIINMMVQTAICNEETTLPVA